MLAPVGRLMALDLMHQLPLEEKVQIIKQVNGVTTLIQENPFPPQGAALRVVVQSPFHEAGLYSLDTSINDLEEIDQFFQTCKEHALSPSLRESFRKEERNLYSGSHICPLIPSEKGEKMTVIAVGDFSPTSMQALIEEHFSDVSFSANPESMRKHIQIGTSPIAKGVALHVDFPSNWKEIKTVGDLKECWLRAFAQELLQQRLERFTRALRENWIHPYPRFLFPVQGFSLASEDTSSNVFFSLLWEIEQIKMEGFNEAEFQTLRDRITYHLNYLAGNLLYKQSSAVASLYADLIRTSSEALSYETFILASENLVPDLRFEEVKPYTKALLNDSNRFIHICYPEAQRTHRLTISEIAECIERIADYSDAHADFLSDDTDFELLRDEGKDNASSSLLQEPSVLLVNHHHFSSEDASSNPGEDCFQSLPLSTSEKETIYYIISNMAQKSIVQLAFKKKKMESRGKKINHLHPMRFIGFILSNPELKKCLNKIEKSSFKWDAFIDGFAKRMKEESGRNNLLPYVDGFAKQVGAKPDKITRFIYEKDWEGLVRFLM